MRRLLSLWNNLSLQTKLGLAFTLLLLFSVPATVLSVNMIKDNRARAAGLVLGDTRYPDPLVSWNRATNFRVEVCLNTSQRGGAYCNANNFPGSNNQISYNSLNGYTYYWFVDLQDYNGAWQQYLTGSYTNNCFNAGGTPQQTCGHTIGWPQPTFDTQAVYAGSALRNACDGFVASCVSSVKDFYPNQQVQYIDLPANIGIDVYIKTGNILFLVLKNLNTGSVAVTSKPTLTIPTFGQQNVSTTNTNFAWTAVPGASYYALWVSTSNDFSNAGFWYKNVQANACTATDCLSSWTNGAWSIHNGNVGPYPPPPASLAKSTTYYWLVWACSSTSCPLPGLATPSNFTTEAAVAQPSVGGLQDSDSPSIPPGVWGTTHKFDWSGANASSFVVDVSTDPNFVSNWAYKVVNVSLTGSLTSYSTTGTGGWANNGNVTWTQNGNLALQETVKYYWRVYAWSNPANLGIHSATPWPEVHRPPSTPGSSGGPAIPRSLSDNESVSQVPPGVWGSTHVFNWQGAGATLFAVDVSSDPNFNGYANKVINVSAAGLFQNYSTTGSGGWANQFGANLVSNGNLALAQGTTYYWRVFAWNGTGVHSATPWPALHPPTFGTPSSVPSKPTKLDTNIPNLICGNNGVKYGGGLVFTYSGSNANLYRVDVSETNNFAGFANKKVSGTTFSVKGDAGSGGWTDFYNATPLTSGGALSLLPNKTYYYRVYAENSAGNVFDENFNTSSNTTTKTFNLQLCATDLSPQVISPPAQNASQTPSFVWNPSSANYYGIAVSDNRDDLLNYRRLWRSSVTISQCTVLGCVRNWTDTNWSPYGAIQPKPTALTPGKTYYWYVWACTSTGCPLDGRVDYNFTVRGSLNQTSPATLRAEYNESLPEVVNFSWSPASTNDGTIDHYKVYLKQSSANYFAGDFWTRDVSPLICYNQPNCKIDNSGPWTWVKGTSGKVYPNVLPKPLYIGNWYWEVVACKTVACDTDVLASNISTFPIKSYGTLKAAATIDPTATQITCENGLPTMGFKWTSGDDFIDTRESEYLEFSLYNNNFLAGTYQSRLINVAFVPLKQNSITQAKVFAPNTLYYWRINTFRDGFEYPSTVGNFTTSDCPPPTGASGSLGRHLDRTGNPTDVQDYLAQKAAGVPFSTPATSDSLAVILSKFMGQESGGGQDCKYHVDATQSTIGAFQYAPGTWKGTPQYLPNTNNGGIDTGFGQRRQRGCWKSPGLDDITAETGGATYWKNTYGVDGYDGGAWDPYDQVDATIWEFTQGNSCTGWAGDFKLFYNYACPR